MADGTVELQVRCTWSAVPLLYPMHPSSGDENGLFTWQHNDRSATKKLHAQLALGDQHTYTLLHRSMNNMRTRREIARFDSKHVTHIIRNDVDEKIVYLAVPIGVTFVFGVSSDGNMKCGFFNAAGVPIPLQDFTSIPSTSWREAFPRFSTGFATPRTRSLDDVA